MLCVVTFTLKMSKHLSCPLTTALKCLAWVNSRSDSVQQVKRSLMNQWRMKISYDRDVQSMQRFNQSIGSLRAARSITLPQVTVKLYLPWVERRREEIHPLQSAREMLLWEGGEGSDQEMENLINGVLLLFDRHMAQIYKYISFVSSSTAFFLPHFMSCIPKITWHFFIFFSVLCCTYSLVRLRHKNYSASVRT